VFASFKTLTKKYLLVVAQVLTSVRVMGSAEFNEFLDFHLRTAYKIIMGWTLYPQLTQTYNYSPTKKQ